MPPNTAQNTCLSQKFLTTNAQSLFNKMDELQERCRQSQPLFVCITETWCMQNEPDSLYTLQGYTIYRRDREPRGGHGGVLIYVNSKLSRQCDALKPTNNNNEELWVRIVPISGEPVIVCCAYRPPRMDHKEFLLHLDSSLCIVKAQHPQTNCIITGDFNGKASCWYKHDTTNAIGMDIQTWILTHNMWQHVNFPTHEYGGQLQSCLDLVISNIDTLRTQPRASLGKSDHIVIEGRVPAGDTAQPIQRKSLMWCWKQADVQGFRSAIKEASWTDILNANDVNQAWCTLSSRVDDLAKQYIPCKYVTRRTAPKPWITQDIKSAIKLKHQLFRSYHREKSVENWSLFKTQRNMVCTLLRRAKSAYVTGLSESESTVAPLGIQSQSFRVPRLHKLIRNLLKPKSTHIPDLQGPNDEVLTTAEGKANALNNFFVSQSRKTSAEEGDPPDIRTAQASTSITKFTTSVAKVAKLLSRIDTSKSTSPDCITARVLRLASDELAPYINKVFELSFETGELPRTWKDAVVKPVYKKGDRSNPGNYRPISLLSATSKVLEKIVCEQLGEQVERHLPEKQSGFRKADGTVPQLTRLLHTMYEALDNGKNVFAVFYDLSKAFDRVWHRGLLAKMEHLGVTGKALNWVAGYSQDRRQKVQLEEASSSWQSIPAGVPQGSILGPLFFLIYTHDLPDAVEAGVECDQFADDTALLSIHSNRDAAVANMQLGVNDTTRWLDDWRLQVNVLKTYAMEITRSTLPHPKPHILLGGSRLEVTSRQKHLGLVITATLSWKEHIASILQKAARVLGVLRRLRRSLSQAALRTIYICYIRPILEYASVTWSNLTRSEADQLERFQRRAARLILGIPLFKRVDHSLLLTTANLPTLESRRACALAVLGQQLFTGAVPNHLKGVNLPKRVATYELRRRQDTQIPTARTSAYRDSVILKSLHTFHSLPMSLQKIKSPHHFRAAVVNLETHICTCSSQPLPH